MSTRFSQSNRLNEKKIHQLVAFAHKFIPFTIKTNENKILLQTCISHNVSFIRKITSKISEMKIFDYLFSIILLLLLFLLFTDTEIPVIKQSTSPGPLLTHHQHHHHQQQQQLQQQQPSHQQPQSNTYAGSPSVIHIKAEQSAVLSPPHHQQTVQQQQQQQLVNGLSQHGGPLSGSGANNQLQPLAIPHRPLLHNLLSGGSIHNSHHRTYGSATTGRKHSLICDL